MYILRVKGGEEGDTHKEDDEKRKRKKQRKIHII